MGKHNYNSTIFKNRLFYTVDEISSTLGNSVQTILKNWRAEGLEIKNRKVLGEDLKRFLRNKKAMARKRKVESDEFYCVSGKMIGKINLKRNFIVDYNSKTNRFLLKFNCYKNCLDCKKKNKQNIIIYKFIAKNIAIRLIRNGLCNKKMQISQDAYEKLKHIQLGVLSIETLFKNKVAKD